MNKHRKRPKVPKSYAFNSRPYIGMIFRGVYQDKMALRRKEKKLVNKTQFLQKSATLEWNFETQITQTSSRGKMMDLSIKCICSNVPVIRIPGVIKSFGHQPVSTSALEFFCY